MRVCVFGPSKAGKSTTSQILSRSVSPPLKIIRGDDYIRFKEDDFEGLCAALKDSEKEGFIFDHISAPLLLERFGLGCDMAIGIMPSLSDLFSRNNSETADFTSLSDHFQQASRSARSLSSHLEICSNSGEAVLKGTHHLRKTVPELHHPVSNFVIKVTSRCNLNCSYCYMYEGGTDQSWAKHPVSMSIDTAEQLSLRIAQHARSNPSIKPILIIHGGEPLSLSPELFRRIVEALTSHLNSIPHEVVVQTNGTRITPNFLQLLDDLGAFVGVSCDGATRESNRHRLYHSKKEAHGDIEAGLIACAKHPFKKGKFIGALCVIDPDASGSDTYRYFRSIGLSSFDFLLQDVHHASASELVPSSEKVLKFLTGAFDAWVVDPITCDVRIFRAVICQLLGADYSIDLLGLQPITDVCISVNGDWELLDVLRVCYDGAWKINLNVRDHSLSDVVASEGFQRALHWQFDFSDTCLKCKNMTVCGGGHLPHRYHESTGFKNPSVHCATLFGLIEYIKGYLEEEGIIEA